MKQLPTQERARKKRKALIDVAAMEFSERPFEQVTAKTIAARAGVATGTFYQYFDNKNDILCVIADDRLRFLQNQIRQLDDETEGGEAMDVKRLFGRILQFVYDFHSDAPELHQVLEQRRIADPVLADILRRGEAVIQARTVAFVSGFNVEQPSLVAESLYAMAEGLVHRIVFNASEHDPAAVLDVGAKMLASHFQ